MAAGPRGLLAFWMGGASAPPVTTSAGNRSLLAPWIGGASAPADEPAQAGARGLLAPWLGGASAPAGAPTQAGYRGLMGFWAGGAAAGPAVEPPPQDGSFAAAGRPFDLPPWYMDAERLGLITADDLLMLIASAAYRHRVLN